jgi:hypothetical protein
MARAFANVVSVDPENFPTGTAGVNGAFVSNTLTVTTGLLTANAGANVVGNAAISGALTVTGVINRNPTVTIGGAVLGNATFTDLQSNTITVAMANDAVTLGTHTTGSYVASIVANNGISGSIDTESAVANLAVVPGNGLTTNATGVHVVGTNGINSNSSAVFIKANNGVSANASGLFVKAGTDLVVNSTGVHVSDTVARLASPTFTGTVTTANLTITGMITANSADGLEGQVLRTDGSIVYWGLPLEAGDTGFIVDVTAGNGIVKSGTASEPVLAVKANNGITANASGLFVASANGITVAAGGVRVQANLGLTSNTSGLFVKANTGLFTNTSGLFVNASSVSVGTLPVARGGTGATTFTSGALLKGSGTGAIQVASAADIVAQINTTAVAVTSNTVITNDISSAVTVYPVWVDGTSGNRANKVSSTKLSFNPSTGILTATGFSGNGSSISSVTAAATTGTLTRGTYLTGSNFNGSANQTWAVDATPASTASKVVARDANSSFSANVVNVNVLNTSSDIQLKSNLVIIGDAVEKVKALNGYTYDRIGSLHREAGVVAQEVQSVLPEVVSQENGYLTVAYGNMIALLIEAIKDQQVQIDELKSKLGD